MSSHTHERQIAHHVEEIRALERRAEKAERELAELRERLGALVETQYHRDALYDELQAVLDGEE